MKQNVNIDVSKDPSTEQPLTYACKTLAPRGINRGFTVFVGASLYLPLVIYYVFLNMHKEVTTQKTCFVLSRISPSVNKNI
jgi:hypothetical protein